MAASILSRAGDVVDQLALAAYGYTAGSTEAVLAANPGLAVLGPVLPAGVLVVLPPLAAAPTVAIVKLWD